LALSCAFAATAAALDPLGWAPRNRRAIESLMSENGRGSEHYDPDHPPYAVFDWDQTSAFLDCGEAYFRWQLWNLELRLTNDELRSLLKDEIEGVRALSPEYGGADLASVDADVLADWAVIREKYSGFGGKLSLDEIHGTPEFRDFITKVGLLYEGYCDTAGIGAHYAYPWILFLLNGYTIDEVQAIARAAIEANLGDALGKRTWKGPEPNALDRKWHPVDYTFRTGLRAQAEMEDLMASFRAAGIDVYVVTASLKQVVEVFAGPERYGYNVPADHVLGMELETKDGRFLPRYRTDWVQTNREGKVQAIRSRLGSRGDPIFAAGDSDGDYQMLTEFKGTKLSLIMNRTKGGDIGKLCKLAVEQKDRDAPRFILQGRNDNTGMFIPTLETIPLGKKEAKLLSGE
jgi:phosphoserine phosphatase